MQLSFKSHGESSIYRLNQSIPPSSCHLNWSVYYPIVQQCSVPCCCHVLHLMIPLIDTVNNVTQPNVTRHNARRTQRQKDTLQETLMAAPKRLPKVNRVFGPARSSSIVSVTRLDSKALCRQLLVVLGQFKKIITLFQKVNSGVGVGMLLIRNVALSCVDVVNDKNVSDKQGWDLFAACWLYSMFYALHDCSLLAMLHVSVVSWWLHGGPAAPLISFMMAAYWLGYLCHNGFVLDLLHVSRV